MQTPKKHSANTQKKSLGSWVGCSVMNLTLGFSRCCLLYSQHVAHALFGSGRVWLWIFVCDAYAVYVLLYGTPPLFSGIIMAWSTNPHYGYFDDFGTVYSSRILAYNNMIVCTCEICVYTTLLVLYFRATHMGGGGSGGGATSGADKSHSRKESRVCKQSGERRASSGHRHANKLFFKIYIQIICVGIVHLITSISYVVMQFFSVTFFTSFIASSFYLLSQGLPPISEAANRPAKYARVRAVF